MEATSCYSMNGRLRNQALVYFLYDQSIIACTVFILGIRSQFPARSMHNPIYGISRQGVNDKTPISLITPDTCFKILGDMWLIGLPI